MQAIHTEQTFTEPNLLRRFTRPFTMSFAQMTILTYIQTVLIFRVFRGFLIWSGDGTRRTSSDESSAAVVEHFLRELVEGRLWHAVRVVVGLEQIRHDRTD